MNELRLLASGRAADVFDLADGYVLRRYRHNHDTSVEARLMTWLHSQGYPVPAVRSATRSDLVMARIEGPTMFDALRHTPERVDEMAYMLAALQRQLHGLDAPAWLPTIRGVPNGQQLLHLDLHPVNVLMSRSGPVVIDWTNAAAGPADFDIATTLVTIETAALTEPAAIRLQQAFVASFLRHSGSIEHPRIEHAAALRMSDPNTTQIERARLDCIRRRADSDVTQTPNGRR